MKDRLFIHSFIYILLLYFYYLLFFIYILYLGSASTSTVLTAAALRGNPPDLNEIVAPKRVRQVFSCTFTVNVRGMRSRMFQLSKEYGFTGSVRRIASDCVLCVVVFRDPAGDADKWENIRLFFENVTSLNQYEVTVPATISEKNKDLIGTPFKVFKVPQGVATNIAPSQLSEDTDDAITVRSEYR
jgi:hypothetical protein